MDNDVLNNPELYINRELSMLEFHRRVLAQAKDEAVPLLERLRFLCISSSVLDEFFEIRVAGLKQQEAYGAQHRGPDNMSASEQLRHISQTVRRGIDEQYLVLNDVLLPALDAEGIRFIPKEDWDDGQRRWIKRFFNDELEPVMSPIGLDPAHPFPQPLNKSLTFIVTLDGKDAFGRNSGKAILQAPRSLPRVIRLPESCAASANEFVLLSSIIDVHAGDLFLGMKATGVYQFRVTRNSDLFVDEEEVDDLLRAVEGELSSRRYGDAVRLEVAKDCPEDLEAFLIAQFHLSRDDVYLCNGPVNLMRLATVPDLVDRPDLKYPGFTPSVPERIRAANDMFEAIARRISCCTTPLSPLPRSSSSCARRPATPASCPSGRRCIAPAPNRWWWRRSRMRRTTARKCWWLSSFAPGSTRRPISNWPTTCNGRAPRLYTAWWGTRRTPRCAW